MAAIVIPLIAGCGPPPIEKDFALWTASIKRELSATDLKRATAPLFQDFSVGGEVPTRGLPKEVVSAFEKKPFSSKPTVAYFIGEDKPDKRALFIMCGSGFGHWGIVVFPAGDEPSIVRALHGKIVPWENGVYFFLEK